MMNANQITLLACSAYVDRVGSTTGQWIDEFERLLSPAGWPWYATPTELSPIWNRMHATRFADVPRGIPIRDLLDSCTAAGNWEPFAAWAREETLRRIAADRELLAKVWPNVWQRDRLGMLNENEYVHSGVPYYSVWSLLADYHSGPIRVVCRECQVVYRGRDRDTVEDASPRPQIVTQYHAMPALLAELTLRKEFAGEGFVIGPTLEAPTRRTRLSS